MTDKPTRRTFFRDAGLGLSAASVASCATRQGDGQVARIHRISISGGGVPKTPVPEAEITELGLVGDKQRAKNHGGPKRAVCLYALEVIEMLRAEGHPISPGSTGENITTVGLDWSLVEVGTRFRLGDEVLLEATTFPNPCRTIRESFLDGDFKRVSHKTHPGSSRICARVLETGTVRVGDAVRIVGEGANAIDTA